MNPELSHSEKPASVEPEPAPQNFFSRLIGVWFSPGETFSEIGRAPHILAPILALMIIGGAMNFLMVNRVGVRGIVAPGIEQSVASGRTSREDADKQLEAMTSGRMAIIIKVLSLATGLLIYPIIALIIVGLAKLITMMMGGENEFKPLLSVSLFATLGAMIVPSALVIILLYLKPLDEIDINNLLGSHLGALLTFAVDKDAAPKFFMALARWVDIFYIWLIALLAIGCAAVTRRVKSSVFGMALGAIYLVLALIGSAWVTLLG
jgi:hypothetical protein